MRNQKPFTKQRIFDKAPGENANPLKRVKNLIEKTLRSHLGNGWIYLNQILDSDGLMNCIYDTQDKIAGSNNYFYFGDETGKALLVEAPTAVEHINSLQTGNLFRVYLCSKEYVNTRNGKKKLEKIHYIVNVSKTGDNKYIVTSVWDITQSPAKFDPKVAGDFVRNIFIPSNADKLEQSDYKLIHDAVRFWHTL